jgi:hypothetical protein
MIQQYCSCLDYANRVYSNIPAESVAEFYALSERVSEFRPETEGYEDAAETFRLFIQNLNR